MAVKSIIEVDVDEGGFKAFNALYEKYQANLAKAPGLWAQAGKEVQSMRTGFEAIAAALLAQNELTRRAASEQKSVASEADRAARSWRGISQSAKSFVGDIEKATTSLLRWGALTGVIGGLVGAGGLFGIERLAQGVAANRRSSLGLGTTYGEQQAFQSSFSRLVDPDALLSGVSGALAGNRTALFGAGLSAEQMQGSTAQVSLEVLKSVKRLVDQTADSQLGWLPQARRLGELGFDAERLRLLKRTPQSELGDLYSQFGVNQNKFNLPSETQKSWQDFVTRLDNAGKSINTVFVEGLVKLESGLNKLSKSFEDVIRAFVKSPTLERWITDINTTLEQWATEIAKPEFLKSVDEFTASLDRMVTAVGGAAKWILSWFPEKGPETPSKSKPWLDLGPLGTIDPHLEPGSIADRLVPKFGTNPANAAPAGRPDVSFTKPAENKIQDHFQPAPWPPSVSPQSSNGTPGKYVNSGLGNDGYSPTVVTIENNTGGNVNVSVNGLV
jgi:hypothetical protein